jgi:hypothetical protein
MSRCWRKGRRIERLWWAEEELGSGGDWRITLFAGHIPNSTWTIGEQNTTIGICDSHQLLATRTGRTCTPCISKAPSLPIYPLIIATNLIAS